MGKMNELSSMLDKLTMAGEALTLTGHDLIKTAKAMRNYYSETDATSSAKGDSKASNGSEITVDTKPEVKQYTKENVRGILAAKAAEDDGKYRVEVKKLVRKYANGGSLKDVNANDYAALITEVEGLKDA